VAAVHIGHFSFSRKNGLIIRRMPSTPPSYTGSDRPPAVAVGMGHTALLARGSARAAPSLGGPLGGGPRLRSLPDDQGIMLGGSLRRQRLGQPRIGLLRCLWAAEARDLLPQRLSTFPQPRSSTAMSWLTSMFT